MSHQTHHVYIMYIKTTLICYFLIANIVFVSSQNKLKGGKITIFDVWNGGGGGWVLK